MGTPSGLQCVRCGKLHALDRFREGCDSCLALGISSNLTVAYAPRAGPGLDRSSVPTAPASMWRWSALLPADASEAVSLSEGQTPLVSIERLGLGPVWLKDESRNPTWSFKDRLASSAVTMAKKMGARVIASSSTGNAGAATAAYAARAGLPCVIVTYAGAAGPLVTQMRAYGAMLVSVPTSADRWTVLSAAVHRWGWFPTSVYFGPAVGSNPLGIEGYKTLAYEIVDALNGGVPDWCALPVCYGDAVYGMWKGFEEMRELGWIRRTPRFLAAEVSGSLERAVSLGEDMPAIITRPVPSVATSIGALQGTVQGTLAVRRSGGAAVFVSDPEIVDWSERLARIEGVFPEPSAAAVLPAIARMRERGDMKPDDTVVALFTAGGLKDPALAQGRLGPVPHQEPMLRDTVRALKEHYGFDCE